MPKHSDNGNGDISHKNAAAGGGEGEDKVAVCLGFSLLYSLCGPKRDDFPRDILQHKLDNKRVSRAFDSARSGVFRERAYDRSDRLVRGGDGCGVRDELRCRGLIVGESFSRVEHSVQCTVDSVQFRCPPLADGFRLLSGL